MLREQLIQLREEYANSISFSSKLLKHFMLSQDYVAKINAINKLILDIDLVDVQYSARDICLLGRGKLSKVLSVHHEKLPLCYSYEIRNRPACKVMS